MFGLMFSIPFLMFTVVFIVILVKIIGQWHNNNQSPRLTVEATVVAKRGHTTHHHDAGNLSHSHSSTTYYATFQFESGDRLELQIPRERYGYLVEGDRGQLTFQGTRFLDFTR